MLYQLSYPPFGGAGFEPATSNGEEQIDRAAAYRGRSLAAVGRALRHHGAWETLIWSDTCGLSSCLSTVWRTRCFVLKAQYVKNFISIRGSLRHGPVFVRIGVQPFAGIPFAYRVRKTANPVVSDRVRERSCVGSSLSYPVPYWAGFHIETLEALVHLLMLTHKGCYPSLDGVVALHSFVLFLGRS